MVNLTPASFSKTLVYMENTGRAMSTDEIWNSFNKQLYAFIFKRVKDSDVTNDILQDVFLKIHSKLGSLRSESKLKSWLYQITRNTIVDHFRNLQPGTETELVNLAEDEPDNNIYLAAEGCLRKFLNHIPPEQKEAIEQVYYQNISQKELAEKLDISYSALKSRVQRGKHRLEELLRECCVKSLCLEDQNDCNC